MSHSPLDLLQHILDEVNFLLTKEKKIRPDLFDVCFEGWVGAAVPSGALGHT